MKKITIVWTITLLFIMTGLTIFGFHMKKEIINELTEESLIKSTKKYLKHNSNLYPKLNNEIVIKKEELLAAGYDPKFEKVCDGYTIVKNTTGGFEYIPYIRCSDYVTNGYVDEDMKEESEINEDNR